MVWWDEPDELAIVCMGGCVYSGSSTEEAVLFSVACAASSRALLIVTPPSRPSIARVKATSQPDSGETLIGYRLDRCHLELLVIVL